MILSEIVGFDEKNPIYQELEISNGTRQYDFLRSIVQTSLAVQRPFLSSHILKALNFHAITCLHTSAGEFRPCDVEVGTHRPPEPYRVQGLMDDFINTVNRAWETSASVALATFVLWRLNHIHPFINGNGRTARAAAYFVLCVKAQTLLPGKVLLPELLRKNRDRYVIALRNADASLAGGSVNLTELHALLEELLAEQLASAEITVAAEDKSQPDAEPSAA